MYTLVTSRAVGKQLNSERNYAVFSTYLVGANFTNRILALFYNMYDLESQLGS